MILHKDSHVRLSNMFSLTYPFLLCPLSSCHLKDILYVCITDSSNVILCGCIYSLVMEASLVLLNCTLHVY